MWLLLLGILAIFAISFVYSNLGMGGGILFVPLLFVLTDFSEDVIVPISLTLVLANCATALYNHQREKLVDWKLGIILASGAVVGSILGAFINLSTGKGLFLLLFLGVVLVVIIKMLADWLKQSEACDVDDDGLLTRKRITLASFGTVGAGFMCGCLGLGGGVINVPLLIYVLGRSTKKAAGTSFVIMLIAGVVGLATYAYEGVDLDMFYVAVMAPVVLIGSYLGSRWGIKKLDSRQVKLLFILVLLIAVAKVAVDLAGVF